MLDCSNLVHNSKTKYNNRLVLEKRDVLQRIVYYSFNLMYSYLKK